MKILLYNWIPFDESIRGGGVTVYTRNVVNEFSKLYPECELVFLCAGSYYDTANKSIRYERIMLNYEVNCRAFAVINSPVFAPAYVQFLHVDKTLESNTDLQKCLFDFLNNEGPFDVVHFQNLEGLTIDSFSCKKDFPNTKFIYSIHNYYPFCPQVDLWRKKEENCQCDNTGQQCIDCIECLAPREKLIRKMEMTYDLRKEYSEDKKSKYDEIGKAIDEEYYDEEHRDFSKEEIDSLSIYLGKYREKFVSTINDYMDCIIAVSKRVEEIAIRNGINKSKLKVSYIGTQVAENAVNEYVGNSNVPLTMIYMGYQKAQKGFFFLMDALDAMGPELSKKLNLIILARGGFYDEILLTKHKEKFHSVIFQNGYNKEEAAEYLKQADFGVVPVLWEDNLPQVSIEMAASGVPVLASDRGGANELTNNNEFVFEAGNINDFISKIATICENPILLSGYYENYPGLTTMEIHLAELMSIYKA